MPLQTSSTDCLTFSSNAFYISTTTPDEHADLPDFDLAIAAPHSDFNSHRLLIGSTLSKLSFA